MNMEQHKFFLYARKSTDVEDKQVRSIEDQIAELRAFAKQENLNVVDVFIEKQSAKIPGRPIFGKMLARVEQGEADGILAWHADRLARNSVDGGRIIYLLDIGKLASLKFPTLWFENTPQGKFMLNIVFGQSKYYVDSLSENTKRGLRQKVKREEYPGPAPIGYINDSRTKTVVVDRKKAKIIRGAFELYAEGNSRLEDISDFLAQRGILSRGGKRIHKTRATFILSNPFYTGLFKYGGELHEGKYEPIIAKKIFDKVQEVLKQRGRPHHKTKYEPQDFCGLMKCGTCGMSITGEYRVKKQKNGNVHDYIYYHCTKKNKSIKCPEPCIRQEELDRQLSSLIQKFSLRPDWAEKLLAMAEKDKAVSAQSVSAFVLESQNQIRAIQTKLQRLLDGFLEQDIERETYREQKALLLSAKKSLDEKMARIEQKQNDWLEPFQNWIKVAVTLVKIARDSNLLQKKVAAKEIFGSNLRLASRAVRGEPVFPYLSALRAAESVGKIPESLILVGVTGLEPVTLRM
ncbi:MAG: Recombinase [Candidatus Jorgensenbacteria bacterium GW2011_GWA2_45_9]|uniref:Recombinase n=1 Tax=Candidatus Jorgensenbacteria bacterium GW2011_GWA2_45_9 TaxID=1618663 RepID=A0A0G1N539_9BACT|nr:MAG: Recombinase [Candidatus Jorgensenbacteria bacterium GW2011_GWA2_45_9]